MNFFFFKLRIFCKAFLCFQNGFFLSFLQNKILYIFTEKLYLLTFEYYLESEIIINYLFTDLQTKNLDL